MRLDLFMTTIVIASLFMIGGLIVFTEQVDTYDINVTNPEFAWIINRTNETFNVVDTMKGDINPEGITTETATEGMVAGAFNAISKIWPVFKLAGDMIYSFGLMIGLPAQIVSLLFQIIAISILFSIIYMLFRFQPR